MRYHHGYGNQGLEILSYFNLVTLLAISGTRTLSLTDSILDSEDGGFNLYTILSLDLYRLCNFFHSYLSSLGK
jgi:hypothetical protein